MDTDNPPISDPDLDKLVIETEKEWDNAWTAQNEPFDYKCSKRQLDLIDHAARDIPLLISGIRALRKRVKQETVHAEDMEACATAWREDFITHQERVKQLEAVVVEAQVVSDQLLLGDCPTVTSADRLAKALVALQSAVGTEQTNTDVDVDLVLLEGVVEHLLRLRLSVNDAIHRDDWSAYEKSLEQYQYRLVGNFLFLSDGIHAFRERNKLLEVAVRAGEQMADLILASASIALIEALLAFRKTLVPLQPTAQEREGRSKSERAHIVE